MIYNVTRNLHGGKLYISQCCHGQQCQPYCITGSAMIALQVNFIEADTIVQDLVEKNFGNWSIEPVVEPPRTVTIYLGSEVPA